MQDKHRENILIDDYICYPSQARQPLLTEELKLVLFKPVPVWVWIDNKENRGIKRVYLHSARQSHAETHHAPKPEGKQSWLHSAIDVPIEFTVLIQLDHLRPLLHIMLTDQLPGQLHYKCKLAIHAK